MHTRSNPKTPYQMLRSHLLKRGIAVSMMGAVLLSAALENWGVQGIGTLVHAHQPKSVEDTPAEMARKAMSEGVRLASDDQFALAEAEFTQALTLSPELHEAKYWRGRVRFCQGKFAESVADFDQFYEAVPEARSRQWERGIALYYAGRYEDGAAQFAEYQTYHDADVENATWRYLCEAKTLGTEEASRRLLKVGPDPRVPMTKIHQLYQGECQPEAVLAELEPLKDSPARLKSASFYAHLYVGLWYESQGDSEKAKTHLTEAADNFAIDHYMGWVAKVHVQQWREPK